MLLVRNGIHERFPFVNAAEAPRPNQVVVQDQVADLVREREPISSGTPVVDELVDVDFAQVARDESVGLDQRVRSMASTIRLR